MKLIIDIPEEKYNKIEPFLNGKEIKGGFNLFQVLEIIKNGIPLDNVKAEIRQKQWHLGVDSANQVIDIIDKHLKE